jgi:hypothetical protein
MLLTMAKIGLQSVAVGLKGVIVLVFHLLAGATCQNNLGYYVMGNGVMGDK